jgi:hypothetical protein
MVLMVCGISVAPAQERNYSVTTFGAFTTSSKLFPSANSADEFTRGQFLPLNDIFSFGIEFRREIKAIRVQIGLSVEYIATSEIINVPDSLIAIPVKDGFQTVPVELTGYFVIPFSGDKIQLFMGAGVGAYPGVRSYDYAGTQAIVVGRTIGVGIHVVSGVEYVLNDILSLRGVLKFRDVQFESTNRFTQTTTQYNGNSITLSQDPLSSRINIDGMAATMGIVIRF